LKVENWKLILLPLESARAVPGIVQVSALRVCKWKWETRFHLMWSWLSLSRMSLSTSDSKITQSIYNNIYILLYILWLQNAYSFVKSLMTIMTMTMVTMSCVWSCIGENSRAEILAQYIKGLYSAYIALLPTDHNWF
jgi:hypothetical protein